VHIFSRVLGVVRRTLILAAAAAALVAVAWFGPLPTWAVYAVLFAGAVAVLVAVVVAVRTELTVSWEPAPEPVTLALPAPPAGRRRALPAPPRELSAAPEIPPPAGAVISGTVIGEGWPR
jgi:hypothetical protein